jgi:hypothetical protein
MIKGFSENLRASVFHAFCDSGFGVEFFLPIIALAVILSYIIFLFSYP